MTGSRAPITAETAENPLRAALLRGDQRYARSGPALHYILAAPERSLVSEAVVAQVNGMIGHLAEQVISAGGSRGNAAQFEAVTDRLFEVDALRDHCQALALEWRFAVRLEGELAIDPVLSPLLQTLVANTNAEVAAIAMAALAAQARFAQCQRRMQLSLAELPAELFHAAVTAARDAAMEWNDGGRWDTRLRAEYEEGAGRLTLLARLVGVANSIPMPMPAIEDAGVALWLSALAVRSGEDRARTACATADPLLGRLLLTLRAAGVAPPEAERQALRAQPDADLPRGLEDIGTREAAQWLADARA